MKVINFFGWVGLGLIAYGFNRLFEKGDRELIKKVSGRKVWRQNPQVYAYSFELVK